MTIKGENYQLLESRVQQKIESEKPKTNRDVKPGGTGNIIAKSTPNEEESQQQTTSGTIKKSDYFLN